MDHRIASTTIALLTVITLIVFTFIAGSLPIGSVFLKAATGIAIVGVPVFVFRGVLRRIIPANCPKCSARMRFHSYLKRERQDETRNSHPAVRTYDWLFGYICDTCNFETLREHDTDP